MARQASAARPHFVADIRAGRIIPVHKVLVRNKAGDPLGAGGTTGDTRRGGARDDLRHRIPKLEIGTGIYTYNVCVVS